MVRQRTLALSAWLLVLAGSPSSLSAQQETATTERGELELTVRNIMQGPALVGTSPSELSWSPDGLSLYFVWKSPDENSEGLYRVSRGETRPERVPDEEGLRIQPMLSAVYSDDRRWAAYADYGDLYLLDVHSGAERKLLSSTNSLSRVQIAADGSAVYFVYDDNLFRVEASGGAVAQLTDIREGKAPEDEEQRGQREALEEEQRELFQVFEADSLREARSWPPPRDTTEADAKAFYVEESQSMRGYDVSPDGLQMAFTLTTEPKDARRAWVPDYVTEEGYTRQAPRKRTLVGDEQSSGQLGIMDLETGEVTFVDPGQDDRTVELRFRGWSDGGERLLAVGIAFDYHDRWILAIDAATGESKVIDHLHDDAWIGGPAWNSAGWLPGGQHAWYVSEETGFAHLYRRAIGGGDRVPLTSGPWEVIDVELSQDEKEFYLVTSESSPHERRFYRMSVSGRDRRQITTRGTLHGGAGRNISSVAVSPDGKTLAAIYSASNEPPELYLQEAQPDATAQQITESTTPDFRSRDWMVPEIVYIPARDDADVPARLYRPEDPNGAGVIFVHGAGYLQNVHRWWSSYFREYMFHNLLAERGYTVLDIDYRASAGYGRDWRTAIYKHMGGKDLTDQVDGAIFMIDSLGVAHHRVGIYGGSYGGFITLMAMFTEADVFAAGAALRPVTDWAYYNHGYTARILGLPQDDIEAYRKSSPIYHAEGLEGALLMAHGMIDQNVHFQDVVRLSQRLIELGKENWEVAIYPKENHGFVDAWSWTDEYTRILKLFDEYILEPGTERPPAASSN